RKTMTECCSSAARVSSYAASSAAISASVTPRSSAAKPGPSGTISIGELPLLRLLNLPQDRPTRKEARRYWEMGFDPFSPGSCAPCDDPPPSATWLRSRANVGTAVNRCDVPERDVVRSSPPPFRRAPAATPARRGRAPAAVGGENRQERGQ